MFKKIFLFELRYRLKRPATYIYFFIFFLLSFLAVTTDAVMVGGAAGKVYRNSPFVLSTFVTIFSVFGIFVSSAIMGVPVYRDLEHRMDTFFYTLPFTKSAYLAGRFAGSFVVLTFVMSGVGLGMLLGSFMPWVPADTIGPVHLYHYIHTYLVFMIPTTLLTGTIFFSLVALSRNVVAAYAGTVILFVAYLISTSITEDLDNHTLSALLDPFGLSTFTEVTKYWTVVEKNGQVVPFTGLIIYNRLIWLTVSFLLLGFTFYRFKLHTLAGGGRKIKETDEAKPLHITLPKVQQHFSTGAYVKQMLLMARMEFTNVSRDIFFIAILFAGVVFLFLDAWYMDSMYGTTTYPVTYNMLQIKDDNYGLMVYVILIMFSGEMVWRERQLKFSLITDAFPVPNWMLYGSKFMALALICLVLVTMVPLAGIITQSIKGYYNFELSLYAKEMYLITFFRLLTFGVLCFFVHTLVNNKFLGLFTIIVYMIANIVIVQLDYSHPLYRFNSEPGYTYSDMNGYGHFVEPLLWFRGYWVVLAVVLAIAANLLWSRGVESDIKNRLKVARSRWKGSTRVAFALALVAFAGVGAYIFYNTNTLNTWETDKQGFAKQARYEKQYKKWEGIAQPRITAIKVAVDIYPEELRANAKGTYTIQNKTGQPIDSLHLRISDKVTVNAIALGGKPAERIYTDEEIGYYIYKITPALQPGVETTLDFDLGNSKKGFTATKASTSIVYNGTFFNNTVLPSIGYDPYNELSDNKERKKQDLPEKERMNDLHDHEAYKNTYISSDADWVSFEAIVSTSPDQIAIAPGYLQREWTEGNRKFYHYSMGDTKILNFYSFMSARYEVRRDEWKSPEGENVAIEIYYHKGHEYNLDRMVNSVKQSLSYFTANFSPYQHKQVRIIEFPRYAQFAQAFPNTIPYSEAIGFIARVREDEEKDIDFPYYVTAHEVAHQWWAHQVIGANVQGSTVLSETMAQYSALMVMEKQYGKDKMKRFLSYELDKYLKGRSSEREKELPLYRVENQPYIHYRKGSLVMYALKDYIGEENLNKALAAFIKETAYQEAPYTTSLDFMKHIRNATPDSLQYLVNDMFEKITLYENRVTEARYKDMGNNTYLVSMELDSKKFYADSLGNEKEQKYKDLVEVGIFTEEKEGKKGIQKPLYLQKHWIEPGKTKLEFTVKGKPAKAGIDPYNKLIDRNPGDNTMTVTTL